MTAGDDERRRVAVHEAGHACVAWSLGRRIIGVSVVPGRRWAGTTHYGSPLVRGRSWDRLNPTRPLSCWPAAVRRAFESRALIAAAGDAAEHVLWWPMRREAIRVPDPLAEEAAHAAPLTDAQRLRLAAAEADTRGRTDLEVLELLGAAIYPDDFAVRAAWLRWIDAEARSIVASGAQRIERLAAVVVERGRLSGRAVRTILEAG